jgi:hypothetical protein
MRRSTTALALAALLSAAVPAVAASPSIVPQKSIRGARLKMTVAQLKSALGDPVTTSHDPYHNFTAIYHYQDHLIVSIDHGVVTQVVTTSKSDTTANGIGVGSTRRAAGSALHGAKCGVNSFSRDYECTIGKYCPNTAWTTFWFHKSKTVKSVAMFVWPKTYVPPKGQNC